MPVASNASIIRELEPFRTPAFQVIFFKKKTENIPIHVARFLATSVCRVCQFVVRVSAIDQSQRSWRRNRFGSQCRRRGLLRV